MAITSITRDWGTSAPNLVRIATTNTLSEVSVPGYMLAQADNISAINSGVFEFLATDIIMIAAADGQAMFVFNVDPDDLTAASNFYSLYPLPGSAASVSKSITAAQFLGMYAAPVAIVPAPGSNLLIVVKRAELVLTYGSAQLAAGGVVAFQYDSTINGAGVAASSTQAAAGFTGAAASTTYLFNGSTSVCPFTTTVNKGIYLSNLTAAYTTGDSTYVAHVDYSIVQVA